MSEEYGTDTVTLFLKWMLTNHSAYIINTTEPKIVVTSSRSGAQLRVPYNTHLNISIMATFCGQHTTNTNIGLSYGESIAP